MLSSEEEEEEDDEKDPGALHVQALEGDTDSQSQQNPDKIPEADILPSDINNQVSITKIQQRSSWIALSC